jgi:hypothetical protein
MDTRQLRVSAALGLATTFILCAAGFLKAEGNDRSHNVPIVPPDARFQGLSYGEWMARFNQWFLSVPAADNPGLLGNEDKLAIGQPDHLWFLTNTLPVVNRSFTVPTGTGLFAMIFGGELDNFFCTDPDTHHTVEELRASLKSIVDSFTDIQVQVDGETVENVVRYRATTPEFSSTLPSDNIVQAQGCSDALPGTYAPMVGDGYFLILPPLPVGEHTIHETGVYRVNPSDPTQDVPVDVLWHVTVVPKNQ